MDEQVQSDRWPGQAPGLSVVISTYRRPDFLSDLVAALEALEEPAGGFEVVLVDNGGGPGSWDVLSRLVAETTLAALAIRLGANRGPGGGRNVGVKAARAPVIAVTDDDCLPTPSWARALAEVFDDPTVTLAQGATRPEPNELPGSGPWDHTQRIGGMTPWFETCNVAYRSSSMRVAGGFDETDVLTGRVGGRAFGEDALIGHRVLATGGRAAFVPEAVVHHRVIPATFRRRLADVRDMRSFPGLVDRIGPEAARLHRRAFLNRSTLRVDLGVVAVAVAAATRSPWPLVGAVPWIRDAWATARTRSHGDHRRAVRVLPQVLVSDGVGLVSLIEGSIRHRRIVL